MEDFRIVTQLSFDWMIVLYFFLGGISGGSFIFSVVSNYWIKRFKPMAKTAVVISILTLAAGMLVLITDLGMPLRFWRLFTNLNPKSSVSLVAWLLNVFFALNLLYAFFLFRNDDKGAKKFAYAGFPFSILISTYTGVLLMQSPGRALWHSSINPIMLFTGGLISAIALIILFSGHKVERDNAAKLGIFLAWLISLELLLTLLEVIFLVNSGTESRTILKGLLIGDFSRIFWLIHITLGGLLPLFLLFKASRNPLVRIVASILVLIGIYTMRYILVIGGQVLA